MSDQLLTAIETFYDCVGDDYDRMRALSAYSTAADDSGIVLADVDARSMTLTNIHSYNIPGGVIEVLTSQLVCPDTNMILLMYPKVPVGAPTLGRVFVSDEVYRESLMYQLASKPYGLHDEGLCVLSREAAFGRICSFVRHKHQDALDPDGLSRFAVLGKHLQRAMSLQQRINRLDEALIQSNNVLDLIEFGLILFGKDRSPLYVNISARRILDAKDGLRLHKRELSAGDSKANQALQALLEAAYQPNLQISQKSGGIVAIPRLSRLQPYSLMVVPMTPAKSGLEGSSLAVFLFDPSTPRTTAIELFVSSYCLTRSEAELAHFLALGGTLDEAAEQRGVSRNTVKSQLHSIFSKTETNRQSELISLLLRSLAGINLRIE